MEIVVIKNTVMTAIATQNESYPFPEDRAFVLLKSGLFRSMREELEIRIWYDKKHEAIQLNGHEDGIKRAKYRLERLLNDDATTIRIESISDTCGLVIGKQGNTIRKI